MLDVALQIAVTTFKDEAQEKRNETFYANSEKCSINDGTCSGKSGHPDQQLRVSMRTKRRSKSMSYRAAGRQLTQQVHRTLARSQQLERSMCCYNCSRPGQYGEHCYEATAKQGNSESQLNPPRWQITEVPQTNFNVPRRNNHLTTANAVQNNRTIPIQLDHSICTVLIQIQGVK
jgi:hypothetical protein